MPLAWRLIKTKHAEQAYTGEGARRFGGRWNSRGTRMIYASETIALALLETLVHLDSAILLERYSLCTIQLDDAVIEDLSLERLPKRWRRSPPPRALQEVGDRWVQDARSAVLRVPSAIVPIERNLLFNPVHPDFASLTLGEPRPFPIDLRLVQ